MEAIVTDSFEMKGRVALEYGAAGVVICVTADNDSDQPKQGRNILLVRPDGWMMRTKMGEVKNGGKGHLHSIFIANLTKEQTPIGTRVRWGTDFWPSVSELEQSESQSLARV
jgi:hypothetical protein